MNTTAAALGEICTVRMKPAQEAAGAGPAELGVIARVAASTGVVVVVHEHTLEVGATRSPRGRS